MSQGVRQADLASAFVTIRALLTTLCLGVTSLVLLMMAYSYFIEGQDWSGPGANIGLGLLLIAAKADVIVALLWLIPPYRLRR